MAPIKQEEYIKEKLEQRKLQPSSQAWSQLANRLNVEEKKSNKSFWWLGIAASIVLIIAVSFTYFNNDSENKQPILVDVETESETLNNNLNKEVNKQVIQEALKEVNEAAVVETQTPLVNIEKNTIAKQTEFEVKQVIIKNKEAIVEIKNPEEVVKSIEKPLEQLKTFEEVKILDVVAEIQKMQQEPTGVSDREIDSLLKVAHKEILTQRIYNETTKTVDADALLQDVEADLEQSFRGKVFEALKSNYSKVKTAVAERNN